MRREIVELDDLLLIEARHVAQQNGQTLDQFLAEALQHHVHAKRKPTHLSVVGIGASAGGSSNPEDLDRMLIDGLDPIKGWSPDRGGTPADEQRRATH